MPTTSGLADRLQDRIRRHGPLPFEQYVDTALYDPEGGFYASGGSAGRRGDFLTSPEVGPLFGAVLARALDRWWAEQGRPDPWLVVDAGAGSGTLARSVLAAEPACASALRYVLVERSAALRARHHEHLPLEPAEWAFTSPAAEDDEHPVQGIGPLAVSLAELPEVAATGVVLANELLDNLPFAVAERGPQGWHEVWVGADGGDLVEVLVPARPAVTAAADASAAGSPTGARVPVHLGATAWLGDVLERLDGGRVVVLDYAVGTTAELAVRTWTEWLRTYCGHDRGGDPLDDPGEQDITVEIAIDQLARVRPPTSITSQADFLARHGLPELVDEGRRIWAERAALGDLAAFRARSRIREAEALTDPSGLGAFTVLEWVVP